MSYENTPAIRPGRSCLSPARIAARINRKMPIDREYPGALPAALSAAFVRGDICLNGAARHSRRIQTDMFSCRLCEHSGRRDCGRFEVQR